MKIIILITMLLIPVSGYCLSGNTYRAAIKPLQDQKNIEVKAEQDKINAEKQQLRQIYLDKNGAGFINTKEEIDRLIGNINELAIVKSFSEIKRDWNSSSRSDRMKGIAAGAALGGGNGVAALYPGTSVSVMSGAGHLVQSNEIVDYAGWNLFKYTLDADNGLHYVYTFGNPITVKISDGTNMILLKINMEEPNKSRVSDGNLPVNAMNTITQVYAKKGISVSDKMLMTLIENWYKAELMPAGKTLQKTMTGLLVDVDTRSDFVKYVKTQAKVAVKPVDDDE